MKYKLVILFSVIFLVACNQSIDYEKDEVVAVLMGEEILFEDVLKQYPIRTDYVDIFLREEVIVQEAKETGIVVTEEEVEELKEPFYNAIQDVDMENFYERQGEELGITPEEYFELWSETYLTRDTYIQRYIHSVFELPDEDEEEEWEKEVQQHMADLFFEYQENGDLVISDY
ncbi:hypothetical protein QA612_07005 [Evansella sp. AB-P1]|uniref:hypothetical protein n=1 Tax=Evansella sp. AB-P1 TaxID=3037653 RepID=UPI00241F22B8|nr:hypothetical protein [Evansella sp. AB-P1]MDG5787237.1 hypothetical protein [Evansella sp. AB-P1]